MIIYEYLVTSEIKTKEKEGFNSFTHELRTSSASDLDAAPLVTEDASVKHTITSIKTGRQWTVAVDES